MASDEDHKIAEQISDRMRAVLRLEFPGADVAIQVTGLLIATTQQIVGVSTAPHRARRKARDAARGLERLVNAYLETEMSAREVITQARRQGVAADITRFPAVCGYWVDTLFPCGEEALVLLNDRPYCTRHAEIILTTTTEGRR